MRTFTPKRLGAILMIVAVALGINFFGFLLPQQQKRYGPTARTVSGVVVSKDPTVPIGRNARYRNRDATVSFHDGHGVPHNITSPYAIDVWNDMNVGDHVTMHYPLGHPEDALDQRASKGGPPNPLLDALVCGGMLVLGAGLFTAGGGFVRGGGGRGRPYNPTVASDPGRVTLSRRRLARLCPEFGDPGGGGAVARIENLLNDRNADIARIADHLENGDSRAAVVVSAAPLLVSAYTDELDCVALLCFPDAFVRDYELSVGSRLLSVNRYGGGGPLARDLEHGPASHHRWTNFQPLIADFLSDDRARIAARKSQISEREWDLAFSLGQRWLAARGTAARDGRPNRSQLPAG